MAEFLFTTVPVAGSSTFESGSVQAASAEEAEAKIKAKFTHPVVVTLTRIDGVEGVSGNTWGATCASIDVAGKSDE
ncbi:hypothetical protein V0R50_06985 [Pseudomonas sp. 148P]|uniref:Uncharacterized protein n=1 Tax=Pseudomonas ulcerans TaxID=3115852 RepID=A0ABU7HN60_9PSED|nr:MULTISPECIES: hypothetical protein [unclassified Pseudomonas]MEE1922485.1 hypothetical protein [Pseudomonas sp. 147P]MEE1932959.1 hypothetical protein [Pseudomonas sp. 148P]